MTSRPVTMAKEFAESFYKSRRWKDTRRAYMKSKGGLCERCLKKGLYVPADIVHHRIYIGPENIGDPSITLAWKNLEALCRDCHAQEHLGTEKRYTVDEYGRVTPRG